MNSQIRKFKEIQWHRRLYLGKNKADEGVKTLLVAEDLKRGEVRNAIEDIQIEREMRAATREVWE